MKFTTRTSMAAGLALLVASCGGGSSPAQPPPSSNPVQVTETFTGSTIQTGTNSCTGDSHNITAAEGEMSVRLTSTSDPAGALSVQVCGGGVDTGNCSIQQQKITVNQTITGTRRGVAQQNLKFLPHSCVFGGPPAGAAVTYSATLTYWK